MKKILVSLFTLVLLFTLVSCECDHVDEDGNKVCDKCNLVLEEKCTEHKDDNNDNVCDNCGEKLSEPHNHVFVNGECECGVKDPNYVAPHEHEFVNGECECGEKDPNYVKPSDSIKDQFDCITIAEAIALATEAGSSGTKEQYYVYGIIEEVTNGMYGEMTIKDETGSIYVYGVYSADAQTRYDAMTDKPVAGDEVVLLAMLKTYNGKPELDRGYLQAFKHNEVEVDLSDYPDSDMSIESIREEEAGTLIRATGVVTQITYAFGMNPNGFYLVDETGSIYVYGNEAISVSVGNKITIVGEKTYYVLEKEQSAAKKYGYKGSCQIQDIIIISNDKGNNEPDYSWVEETTVKDIIDTPFTSNITTTIYKVNALVTKDDRGSFVNYYFNDLDGVTGSYTYTACSGEDFAWLDEFDGKVCSVYLSPINAKSTSSGCIWRFLPIKVTDEGFTFDKANGASFVGKYYILEQFLSSYESDPSIVLLASVSNDIIGIENAKVTYKSSNTDLLYFEEIENGYILHTKDDSEGKVTVSITVEYESVKAEYEVEIELVKPVVYDTISVQDAINSEDGTEVILRGIVASSLVNQSGFYLIDDTGVIAVVASADQVALLSSGDEVVVTGTKTHRIKDGYLGAGQINIDNATILANYYGNHEYSTSTFDHSKTLEELYAFDHNEDHSTEVYVVNAKVKVVTSYFYTSLKITSLDGKTEMSLYCSSADQYGFLKAYDGKEVTLELALCNWNGKDYYAGCVISVTYNGEKTVNTLNFE